MTHRVGTVVKVGGSLFELPDLRERLECWLAKAKPSEPILLIAGCGPLADTIRTWQERFVWSDEHSHALCYRLLEVSAEALWHILGFPSIVYKLGAFVDGLSKTPQTGVFVLDPHHWLRTKEPRWGEHVLPTDWTTTTDSIAARVAEYALAAELVLLKSTLPPSSMSSGKKQLEEWSAAGIVDGYFPSACRTEKVSLVNLKDDAFPRCELNSQASPSPPAPSIYQVGSRG